jgi:hypothetical protein
MSRICALVALYNRTWHKELTVIGGMTVGSEQGWCGKMPIFVRDPCGIVCILLTYVAVLYADYVVIRWIILQTMQNRYNLQYGYPIFVENLRCPIFLTIVSFRILLN